MHGHRRPCRATVSAEWAGGKLCASPTGSKHLSEGWGSKLWPALAVGAACGKQGPCCAAHPLAGRLPASQMSARSAWCRVLQGQVEGLQPGGRVSPCGELADYGSGPRIS